ncbi:MAG: ABC transporter ATP-binding protein/permease [Clostridiales bacterium]|jgi:ATP-binding cassette subfamily B protein|nr:ABC transporter ATP-binding protein/permease [Clostridiales bacterium]
MIKKLARSIREFKSPAILTPILVVIEVFFEVIIPFLMADLIDNGIESGDMRHVAFMGVLLIALSLIAMFLGALAGSVAAKASTGFARNLRKDMFYNVQNFSFSNIDKFSTSSLVTRLTTDVMNVQNAFQMIIRMAVRCPVMLVMSFIAAFSTAPDLALIFLCSIPILTIGLLLIMTSVHPIFKRVFKTYDKLNKIVQENVRGVRVVKSYAREKFEESKFYEVSKQIFDDFSRAEKRLAFNMPIMQFCMFGGMLLISWIGARMVVGGELSTGQLMSVFTYSMQILMSLMMLSMVFVMLYISRASAERITEVLDEQSDLTNRQSPITTIKDGSLVFNNVSFSYSGDKEKLSLIDVNLEIKSGETIGILGGTGSSKTTLVQLIPRLYDVTEGSLTVGGVDVRDLDIKTLRDNVAMVLQKNILFGGTIKENLRWGSPDATDAEIIHACKLAQADSFIEELPDKYDTMIEQGGTNVSGGQKQRLCIARALLKHPKVLILDDSTSAVDTRTDAMIRKSFKEDIPHITKLIIAQRVASVQDANKIVVLDNGKVHAVGTHDELLDHDPIYTEVYNSQTQGGDFDEAI